MEDLVGRRLGPCAIEAVLGSGGMGTVYRARHLALDRVVAVKVVRAGANDSALDRWLVEARAAARVEDPRVVRIYDAGREGELRYVVMQLVEGRSLAETIELDGPMTLDRARLIVAEVALGLASVHRQGVVHRDVKPSNVMLTKAGGTMLVDFGVAATVGQERGAAGSTGFMAPEQAYGAPADPRQDIYGLGGCLWYCLTGKPPQADWSPSAEELRSQIPGLTPYASQLLAALLDSDPQRRLADAARVAQALKGREMVLVTAPSGSPTDLLEPPPLPPSPAPRPAAAAPQAAAVCPAPPPAPPQAPGFSPLAGLLLAAVFLLLFGRPWARVGPADWLGAGGAAALGLSALAFSEGPDQGRRAAALALLAAMAAALLRLAGPWQAPAALEAWIVGGLGLTMAVAGALVAFWGGRQDRRLGCALLLCGCVAVALAACGRDLPEGFGWFQASAAALDRTARALTVSGGLWRWGGPLTLYALWRIKRASC